MAFLFSASVSFLTAIASANSPVTLEQILKPLNGTAKADTCEYSRDSLVKYSEIYGYAPLRRYWACIMLRKNLNRDSKSSCKPTTPNAFRNPASSSDQANRGTIAYLGFAPMRYLYDTALLSNETPVVKISVFFKGQYANRANLALMQAKMNSASRIWEGGSLTVHPTTFKFTIAKTEAEADFAVELLEKGTRGPYNKRWSVSWSSNTVAHELGHMMGLDDEYDNLRVSLLGKTKMSYDRLTRCDPGSIMCSSYLGNPQPHHYYTILRRRGC